MPDADHHWNHTVQESKIFERTSRNFQLSPIRSIKFSQTTCLPKGDEVLIVLPGNYANSPGRPNGDWNWFEESHFGNFLYVETDLHVSVCNKRTLDV